MTKREWEGLGILQAIPAHLYPGVPGLCSNITSHTKILLKCMPQKVLFYLKVYHIIAFGKRAQSRCRSYTDL